MTKVEIKMRTELTLKEEGWNEVIKWLLKNKKHSLKPVYILMTKTGKQLTCLLIFADCHYSSAYRK